MKKNNKEGGMISPFKSNPHLKLSSPAVTDSEKKSIFQCSCHHFVNFDDSRFWAPKFELSPTCGFFPEQLKVGLGHGIGYRVSLHTRLCAEILAETYFFHFPDFWLGFQPVRSQNWIDFSVLMVFYHPETQNHS